MHLEFRHLRSIKTIHEAGGLARAAELLNVTQSALSHQIKGLEDQAGVELFVRRSKPLRLSAAGKRLLRLAEQVLPQVEALQAEFEGLRSGVALDASGNATVTDVDSPNFDGGTLTVSITQNGTAAEDE